MNTEEMRPGDLRVDGGTDGSVEAGEAHLAALAERLREVSGDPDTRAEVLLEQARALLRLERARAAWAPAREAFDLSIRGRAWERAVAACEVLFLTEETDALVALGHGIWLAVTFPISPEVTVEVLRRVVEETPDDSDGAAVAAATAHYVADLRGEGGARDSLLFYAGQMLSDVARRHSQVDTQEQFEHWRDRLELDQPDRFLPRLGQVVEVLVHGDWWIDREAIRAELPVN
jgi:hypothetical protein